MFEARNLSLSVGTKELLSDTSFRVGDTDHVGLVGLNGTGKSTLLRLISGTGSDSALISNGQFIKSAETTIGYLPQEISFEGDLEKQLSIMHCRPMPACLSFREKSPRWNTNWLFPNRTMRALHTTT